MKAATELAPTGQIFLSKQHWDTFGRELLQLEGIFVVNIIRDIRDVIVSRYFHNCRALNESLTLPVFIEQKSEFYIKQHCAYHNYWSHVEPNCSSYYMTSYEYLSDNLVTAAQELYRSVGFSLSDTDLLAAANSTRFDNLKHTGPGTFFRKGKSQAFIDDLAPHQSSQILDIAEKYSLKEIKRRIARINPAIEPYLAETDVSL